MKTASLLFGVLPLLFLSACSTGPTVSPQVTSAVSAHDVDQGTYNKIAQGQTLDYNDIVNLVSKKVPTDIIVGYLQSTETSYHLSHQQIHHLRSLGAKPELLNYLNESEGFYGPEPTIAHNFKKYFKENVLINLHPKKVYYNGPITPCWYDDAYEQSCYSPFCR